MLGALTPEKVCFIISKVREIESAAKDRSGSAPTAGDAHSLRAELRAFLQALGPEESAELAALCWVGRGDFAKENWADAMAAFTERDGAGTAVYLLDMEPLADDLEEGLKSFDLDCADFGDRKSR